MENKFTYLTQGTCSKKIQFEVDENGVLHNLSFEGGCRGNTQGVARLAEGRNIDEIQALLAGVQCRGGTSCPDQLSKAIAAYKNAKQ